VYGGLVMLLNLVATDAQVCKFESGLFAKKLQGRFFMQLKQFYMRKNNT
jgi:hypothetical protein